MKKLSLIIIAAIAAMQTQAQVVPHSSFGDKAYTHKNLTLYVIEGEDLAGTQYLTLEEAMRQGKIKLHETGSVNELSVDNNSDQYVFIMAGDIVKGGRQDRTMGEDVVLKPGAKRIPLESFCVEQSRWSGRGSESVTQFSSSDKMLSDKNIKVAARAQKDQGAVWTNVSEFQSKASANVAKDIRSETSATSLQLALEDNDLQNMVGEYLDVISPAFENNPDAVGFAFAVNGKISTVEWFASPALFGRMRDKLLESAANEAFSNYDKELGFGVPNKLAFDSFVLKALNAPCTGTSENEAVTEKKFETGKIVMFQSFNTGVSSEVPLHITIYSTDDIAQNPQGRNQNQHINNRSISNLMIE